MKRSRGQMNRGFTLIELVMVIVILGILAAVAIPIYVDLRADARTAAEAGVVGSVRSGIMVDHVRRIRDGTSPVWIPTLDSAAAGACNPCFGNVLEQGGLRDSNWSKGAGTSYTGPTTTVYTYDPADGSFD